MPDAVIENPIINSPFREPSRHFQFTEDGITNVILDGRRSSEYFIPIAQTRKKAKGQLKFDPDWTGSRREENKLVNRIRRRVAMWREGGFHGVTNTTAALLKYWIDPDRENKLFFCQIEALETAIYLTECAKRFGDAWMENELRDANELSNPGLPRVAFKMATGSGKTVVMGMLIAWQMLNKLDNPQDARFSDTFVIITPGITIRDRLQVLLPNNRENYYRQRDLVPNHLRERLGRGKILITNFHAFKLRETQEASKLTKAILNRGEHVSFTETPDRMVRRVCRELGTKKNVIVLNDEAHHCYRRKPEPLDSAAAAVPLVGDERKEAEKRDEEARIWISGIEAMKAKIGVRQIFDLSATPFFLRGSGYPEGFLFPWVVSDFALIDAIESGIVKIPRVPVSDNSLEAEQPIYRELWPHIRDALPKKGRKTEELEDEPSLPAQLESAIHSLYTNYVRSFERWKASPSALAGESTPPVFIVVCNNTNVSKMVFNYISGWQKTLPDGSIRPVPGRLELFSNVIDDAWTHRPNTILVDSEQLESGEAMSADFKHIARREIDEFKDEIRARGGNPDAVTDEDLLREVMNTVGKRGRLGEHVKCVVSVSMLTEGWDANTVTHILGVRAFRTQLLCEQVVGRALRRMSYAVDSSGLFTPEYAEVYGVPFSFIPCSGSSPVIDRPQTTRVRALEQRIALEITFPRVVGYRYELPTRRLRALFNEDAHLSLSTREIPTRTDNAPIVGESSILTLDDLKARRLNEVAFLLAKLVLEKYFRQDGESRPDRSESHQFDNEVQVGYFPQVLSIAKRWLADCLTCKDGAFPQMLLLIEFAHDAADRVYQAIVRGTEASPDGKPFLLPRMAPFDQIGSTRYVDFDTARAVFDTRPDKCHISHVVADTDSWEQKTAEALEDMDEVIRYVKNHNLGFTIPYTLNGEEHRYTPDFIAVIDDGRGDGPNDHLNLIIECSGQPRKDKAAKVAAARTLWVPAVNNTRRFGRWEFLEISDPWDAQNVIRARIRHLALKPDAAPTDDEES